MLPILLSEGNIRQILQFLIFSKCCEEAACGQHTNARGMVGFSVIQIVKLKFCWFFNFTEAILIKFHSFLFKLHFRAFVVGIPYENRKRAQCRIINDRTAFCSIRAFLINEFFWRCNMKYLKNTGRACSNLIGRWWCVCDFFYRLHKCLNFLHKAYWGTYVHTCIHIFRYVNKGKAISRIFTFETSKKW